MIGVKAIVPKKLDDAAIDRVLMGELEKYGAFLKRDFDQVVAPWHGDKPTFQIARYMDANGTMLVVRVMGNDEAKKKWGYVNYGTRAHTIRAKAGGVLAFPSVYHSGSTPGKYRTVASSSGGETVIAREVHHPGTEARRFDLAIAADHQRPFESWMKAAMSQAARASGHGK